MTFANKLGSSYSKVKDQTKIKTVTIEAGEVKFDLRVRIPLKKEMEEMVERIQNPSKEKVEEVYKKLSTPILESMKEGGEKFLDSINSEKEIIKIDDDDVVLNGTSVRSVSTLTAIWEIKIEEYFHLLQSETGEPIDETYDQICEEFPELIVKMIVDEIEQAIKPSYSNSKKN